MKGDTINVQIHYKQVERFDVLPMYGVLGPDVTYGQYRNSQKQINILII